MANDNVQVARMFPAQELGTSTYTAFCMDPFGFMWIGTDNGLIRFDGNHYEVYRHLEGDTASISDNRILGLLRDKKDRLWIATANGLNLYDSANDSFLRIDVPDFGKKGYIISFTVDVVGKVTFVVSGVGIYEIKEEGKGFISAQRVNGSESLKDVNCIMSHRNGRIYAGTGKGKVYELTNEHQWKMIVEMNSAVCDISQEHNGSLIINTFKGVDRFNLISKTKTHIQLKSDIKVNNLSSSIDNRVYLATYGAGLWEISSDSDKAKYCDIYCPFIDMKSSRIGAVYGSSDGSLWIGCDYCGVVFLPVEGLSFLYRGVSDIVKDFDLPLSAMRVWKGNYVIGNSIGEVAIVSKEGKLLKKSNIPEGSAITSIDITENDKAILGVLESGVWKLDLNSGVLEKLVDISDKCLSLKVCEGSDGCIYIGVYATGLMRYNPKTGEKEFLSSGADTKRVVSPYITTIKAYDDNLWIGSFGGVACYNTTTGKFEDIDQTPYMACAVFDIVPENENFILLGTSNGLIRYNMETKDFEKYTTLECLSDNDVRSIAIDGNGGKWIGTMRGLNYQSPREGMVIAYIGGNGIVESTFENMEYSTDSDMIYAAGHMGLTSFSSLSIALPTFPHGLKITDMYVKGKKINPIDSSGYPEVIHLSHDENSIAFRISTMDFRDTSNLNYLWRFSGDEDWVELPDGSDLINLSSLAPGKYTLQFKAEEAGVESPVSEITIHVAHPWYLTWLAKIVYILIFIFLLYMVVTVIRKRHQERLHKKKLEFLMDMSRDMRSPLTLILGPLEAMLKERLSSGLRERIRGVYRNAHRILNIVNQLLDLNRIDNGIKGLECRLTNLPDFIAEIVEMFQPQAQDKGIELTFVSKDNWEDVWIDRTVIDRIMVNLISNALKYTPKDGKVEILLNKSVDGGGVSAKICLIGNGKWLEFDSSADIFSSSNRLENGILFSDDSFSLGLDICRRYVRLHHGEIYVEKRKDGIIGGIFNVIIPLEKSKYSQEELINEENISSEDNVHDTDSGLQPVVSLEDKNIVGNIPIEADEDIIQPLLPNIKGNDEALIERVNKILEERIDEDDMNVDKLAEVVGISRTHLYRRMKDRLGINPSEYIRNMRLQRACELLKHDDLDITQIAYALGFSSQSQFSTTFKRFMGYTPTEYRTKHKKDIDSKPEFIS
ncbi:MAG: helix-turn-helix domain-containing protein [Muribaculaceae bacterium]|nr:helix-turn-helix domain-containing protein [Muribaculaceae bacterium]